MAWAEGTESAASRGPGEDGGQEPTAPAAFTALAAQLQQQQAAVFRLTSKSHTVSLLVLALYLADGCAA